MPVAWRSPRGQLRYRSRNSGSSNHHGRDIPGASGWVGFAGLWIALTEHITMAQDEPWRLADGINQHALGWTLLCLLLAGSVLGPILVGLRAGQRQHA